MTNPDLAALSAAATQGEWLAQPTDREGPDYGVFIVGGNLGGLVGAALPWPTEIDSGDFSRVEANAAFIVALTNAYRTGNLVQIDREGMREVLARAYSQGATDVHNCWINDGGQWDADFGEAASDYAHANADAAIAAILGGE